MKAERRVCWGDLYERGVMVPKDTAKAKALFCAGAMDGDLTSMNRCGTRLLQPGARGKSRSGGGGEVDDVAERCSSAGPRTRSGDGCAELGDVACDGVPDYAGDGAGGGAEGPVDHVDEQENGCAARGAVEAQGTLSVCCDLDRTILSSAA